MNLDHSRYYTHDERTARLRALAAKYPHLAQLESIGRSHRGRDIWAMTITNFAAGSDREKPAFYIDGNNHGEEIITSATTLYTIDYVLSAYGNDQFVTELLDTRALYILPCVNPDGAEISFTTPYQTVGNGHYLPWDEHPTGLHLEDINGDGRILQMRVPDPIGEYKLSASEPRLLVLRKPGEIGDRYYRLLPEGILRDWDGVTLPILKYRHGNLNRQFPVNWMPEYGEYGAGELPLNEPEAEAMARFVLAHPNITGVQAYHSHSGVILRPSSYQRDAALPPEDVDLFKTLGLVGTELTGYPVISTYEDFTENQRTPRHGGFGEWVYEHLGLITFSTELWDVETAAGIKKPQFFPERSRSAEEQARLLKWSDEHSPHAYTNWQPFNHPQLGAIEIGGWDPMFIHRNPPPQFITEVAHPNCLFTLQHAAASPLLRVAGVSKVALGHGFYKVTAAVENQGYLPTNISQRALDVRIAKTAHVSIATSAGVHLLMGEPTREVGHLAGRVTRRTAWDPWRRPWGESAARVEWLVKVDEGAQGTISVSVESEKGGKHQAMLDI